MEATSIKKELQDRSAGIGQYELFFKNMELGFSLKELIEKKIKEKGKITILDLGCGHGNALKDLKLVYKDTIRTIGLDNFQSKEAAAHCDEFLFGSMLKTNGKGVKVAEFPPSCDVILSFRVLHEVGGSEELLQKIGNSLAKGGEAFLSIRCQSWEGDKTHNLGGMETDDILFLLDILEKGSFQGVQVKGSHVPVILEGVLKDPDSGKPEVGLKAYIAGVNIWLKK
jgi:SAM-dependent methyltransferase